MMDNLLQIATGENHLPKSILSMRQQREDERNEKNKTEERKPIRRTVNNGCLFNFADN